MYVKKKRTSKNNFNKNAGSSCLAFRTFFENIILANNWNIGYLLLAGSGFSDESLKKKTTMNTNHHIFIP